VFFNSTLQVLCEKLSGRGALPRPTGDSRQFNLECLHELHNKTQRKAARPLLWARDLPFAADVAEEGIQPSGYGGLIPKKTFADETAIAEFGVGKNMVASIRHWALACGVMRETDEGFRVGSLASEILSDDGLDPYAENPSTAWLAHWQLAGHCFRSTTWHWLFNHVTAPTFTRQELEEPLARYARELDPKHRLSPSTISRDLETCLRSYAPRAAVVRQRTSLSLCSVNWAYFKRCTRGSTPSAVAPRRPCTTASLPTR